MFKEATGWVLTRSDILDHSPRVRDAEDARSFWNRAFCGSGRVWGSQVAVCPCDPEPGVTQDQSGQGQLITCPHGNSEQACTNSLTLGKFLFTRSRDFYEQNESSYKDKAMEASAQVRTATKALPAYFHTPAFGRRHPSFTPQLP